MALSGRARFFLPVLVAAVPTVVLLVAWVVHATWLMPARDAAFLERTGRGLGVLARQLEQFVSNARSSAKAVQGHEPEEEHPPPARGPAIPWTPARRPVLPFNRASPMFVTRPAPDLGRFLERVAVQDCLARKARPIALSRNDDGALESGTPGTQSQERLGRARLVDASLWVRDGNVCLRGHVGRLLADLLEGSALNPVDIAVFDGGGRVAFARGEHAARFLRMPVTRLAAGGDSDSRRSEGKPGAQAIGFKELKTAGGLVLVNAGDDPRRSELRLLTRPITFGDERRSTTWVIAAIIPAAPGEAAPSVSPAFAGLLPLLFVLSLISLPALRLRTVGPRQRLSVGDLHWLALSGVIGTALLTMIVADWYAYRHLMHQMDTEMRVVSEGLRENFEREVRRASCVLAALGKRVESWTDLPRHTWGRFTRDDIGATVPCEYPHFEMFVATNASGDQEVKYARDSPTARINVGGLAFFSDAQAGRMLLFDAKGEHPAVRVALHVLFSPTTAEIVSTFSVPTRAALLKRDGRAGVFSLRTRMVSLVDPLLPAELGFAVIEDDGTVLFHSTPRRRLFENLFVEARGNPALRAAVHARRAEFVDFAYFERSKRAFVHPLPYTGWSLVVFRDRELARTANLEACAAALLLFVVYCAGYGLVTLLVRWLWPDLDCDWLWPAADGRVRRWFAAWLAALGAGATVVSLTGRHGLALGAFALAVAVSAACLLVRVFYPAARLPRTCRWALATTLLAAATAAGLAGFVVAGSSPALTGWGWGVTMIALIVLALLPPPSRDATASPPLATRAEYAALGLAVLVALAVVPALAALRDAFTLQMEAATRYRQTELAETVVMKAEEERRRLERFDSKERRHRRSWEDFGLALANFDFDVPGRSDRRPKGREGTNGDCSRWSTLFIPGRCSDPPLRSDCGREPIRDEGAPGGYLPDRWRATERHFSASLLASFPVYSPESRRLREMFHGRASDHRWRTSDPRPLGCMATERADERLTWRSKKVETHGRAKVATVWSPVAGSGPPGPHPGFLFYVLGFGLSLACIGWVVGQFATDVFGLDLEERAPKPGETLQPARGRYLLRPTAAELAKLPDTTFRNDMRQVDKPGAWVPAAGPSCGPPTLLLHLEHRIDEPEWNEAKLRALEHLVYTGPGSLLVTSELDPLKYFQRRLQSPSDTASEETFLPGQDFTRWARVMALLDKERSDWPRRDGADPASLPSPEEARRQWTLLVDETRWTERLRAIRWSLAMLVDLESMSERALLQCIGEAADAHYHVLWHGCTDAERLVLIHLASDGMVNRHNWRTVGRLIRRGLVTRETGSGYLRPRIMNRTFCWFVQHVERTETVRGWERAEGTAMWDRVRVGVLFGFTIIALVAYVTDPKSLTGWLSFLGSLGGGAATLANLFGLYRGAQLGAGR